VSGTADSLKVLDLVIMVPDLWGNVLISSAIVGAVVRFWIIGPDMDYLRREDGVVRKH
jgi:hypothetical protein